LRSGAGLATGSLASLPDLPAIDAAATARYIDEVMAGTRPLPAPIGAQVEALRALAAAAQAGG